MSARDKLLLMAVANGLKTIAGGLNSIANAILKYVMEIEAIRPVV